MGVVESTLGGAGILGKGPAKGLKGAFDPGGTTSDLQTKQFPGIFGAGADPRRLATAAERLLQQPGGFLGQLQQELGQPTFGAQTAAEEGLLSAIQSATQGATAARGLGPATQGALAQALAPTLVGLRQQRVSNLAQALGLEQAGVGQRVGGLLQLGGLAMPQIIAGQQQQTTQPGIGAQVLPGVLQGAAAGLFCWVADELFGKNSEDAFFARFYTHNTDSVFMRAYKKFGASWANFLNKNKWLHPVVKPIWSNMANKGRQMMMEVCYG